MGLVNKRTEYHLNRNHSKIYYYQCGLHDAPVVLLLHGGFGSTDDFESILEYLTSSYRVVGIDSRGQGRSTLGHDGLSYQIIQSDIEAVLNQLGIDTLSIIGFSDGGILAYRLAAYTHLNIEKIISIGSRWHVNQTDTHKDFLETLTGTTWKQMFPEKYEHYQLLNPEPDYDKLTSTYIKMCLDTSEDGHPNEAITKIKSHILAIRGESDPVVTDTDLENLAKKLKNVTVCSIPNAGHSAHTEQRDVFLEHMNKFLNSNID